MECLSEKARQLIGELYNNVCESEETVHRTFTLLLRVENELRARLADVTSAADTNVDVTSAADTSGDVTQENDTADESTGPAEGLDAEAHLEQEQGIVLSDDNTDADADESNATPDTDDVIACEPHALNFSDASDSDVTIPDTTIPSSREAAKVEDGDVEQENVDAEVEDETPEVDEFPSNSNEYVDAKSFFEQLGKCRYISRRIF